MIVRVSKALLVLMIALFALLVGIDNIIDYDTNFVPLQHVMSMDTTFPDSALRWRAVTDAALHHAGYGLIIALELVTGILCFWGALRMWSSRRAAAASFNASKDLAIAGLICGFALWFFGFLVIGGEWFQMWQSKTWNGQQAAFRITACIGIVLIFLNQKDDELA
jgi:predicted small integral membrane protein